MIGCDDSLPKKAAYFVSGFSQIVFPEESTESSDSQQDEMEKKRRQQKEVSEKESADQFHGPDTSSFTAFLFSLLSCSEAGARGVNKHPGNDEGCVEMNGQRAIPATSGTTTVGSRKRRFALAKRSSSKAFLQEKSREKFAAPNFDQDGVGSDDEGEWQLVTGHDLKHEKNESMPQVMLPEMSEPSLLLSEHIRGCLYSALPTLAQGQKWVLLYSTWRHGVSLLTLYRRSAFCPGPCLLVAGDDHGAVFGGLLVAPLKPTNRKKYQGTNDTFVFTNVSGTPVVFRSTGANRYFALCTTDSLALGGGGHFALYLEGDLLHGSSASSETFGNSCLACTEDFALKDVELWGFAYAPRYASRVASYNEPQEACGIYKWSSHSMASNC